MRRLFKVALALIIFIFGASQIQALSIKQESIAVIDKSATINIINDGIAEYKIAPTLELNEVGDFVTYKLVLNNTDNTKYKVESITDDNQNDFIVLEYTYDDKMDTNNKVILLTLKYTKKLQDPVTSIKNVNVKIKFVDEDNKKEEIIINNETNNKAPQTRDNINLYLALFVISLITVALIIRYYKKNKRYSKAFLSSLLILLLIPAVVFAATQKEINFSINFQNVKVNVTREVKLNYDNGQEPKIITINYNEKLKKPADPEKVGYNFVKWVDETGKEFDFDTSITRDYELKAEWKKKVYTVTFDVVGGDAVQAEKVEHGNKAPRPAVPTKKHYEFVNWYVDATYSTLYNFEDEITSDITIYAKWTPTEYTITYILDGGSVTQANRDKYTIETETFTLNNPSKGGYRFTGWTGSNGTNPEEIVKITKGTTGDLTYEANYIKIHTVTYDSVGGDEVQAEKVEDGNKATKPTTDPKKKGYTFNYWMDSSNNEFDFDNTTINSDITLKAKWTSVTYTIKYVLNGGSVTQANKDKYTIETETFTLNNPTKSGSLLNYQFRFDGWTGSNGVNPELVVTIPTGSTEDRTYTANWTKQYFVMFDQKYGTASETFRWVDENTKIGVLPTVTPNPGYTFIGWDINGSIIDENHIVKSKSQAEAKYNLIEYNYSLDPNGGIYKGSTLPTVGTYTTNSAWTVWVSNYDPIPTRDGYKFMGWTGENYTTPNNIEIEISKGSIDDKFYTANWKKIHTVKFNTTGGSAITDKEVLDGETFDAPTKPTREHYIFSKWIDSNGNTYDFDKPVTSDIELTAVWEKEKYNVTFNTGGGMPVPTAQLVEYLDKAKAPTINPQKDHYVFDKWVDSAGSAYDFDTPVTSDIELTAKWNKEEYTVTFNTDGGTPVPTSQKVKYEENASRPADPKKTDYVFKYWMDSSGNEFDFGTSITGNITLTAKWQVEKAKLVLEEVSNNNPLNEKMKRLAGTAITIDGYNTNDAKVKGIKKATEADYDAVKDTLTNDNIISASSSMVPIYMWWDASKESIMIYTEAEKVAVSGSMGRLFSKFLALSDISALADWDTSEVTDMNRVFQNSKSLTNLTPLANWNVSSVKNMTFMFGSSITAQVDKMGIGDLTPLASWDVSNVASMYQMFKNCRDITDLTPLANWNVSGIKSSTEIPSGDNRQFEQMFNWCQGITDATMLAGWNVSNATSFNAMFNNNPNLPDDKKPIFTVKPGTWSGGTYNPNS